jgi:hypothetical protein
MSRTLSTSSAGFLEALLCAVLLFGITNFFPAYFKTWFVEPTGNIQIAPFFGFVFSVGILSRVRWARWGAMVLGWGLLAIALATIVSGDAKPGFWLMLVVDAFLLYLLYSERLKGYFR